MKKQFLLLLSLATGVAGYAQSPLTVAPAVAHPGQTIEVAYNPAGTKLEKQTDIKGIVYLFNNKRVFYAQDMTLTKSAGVWKAKVAIPDTVVLAAFKFSDDKLVTDNNSDKGYYVGMKGADGKPVQGEQMAEGMVNYYLGNLIGAKANPKLTQQLFESEFAAYPASAKGMESMYYGLLIQNKDVAKAAAEKQKMMAAFQQKGAAEADLAAIASAFYTTRPLYDSLSKVIVARYPKGITAINMAATPVYREQDPAKKVELYNNVKNNFTVPVTVNDNMLNSITSAYGAKKDFDNLKKYAALMQDQRGLPGIYNSVAWPLAEKGESLDVAAELSKRSLDIVSSYKTNAPGYFVQYTPTQREEMIRSSYGSYADTYALILYKQGKIAEALSYQQKAVEYSKGASAEVNERLVTFLAAAGKTKEAMAKAEDFIKNGKSTETMKTELKAIYAKEKGEKGFDTYMAGLQSIADAKLRAEIMDKMINLKATGFALKDFSGNEISLAALKGKVVIVDFWATWCGPCKASFPAMQKMVNKYKGNPNVEFVFVDTWETDPKKDELVRKFIADNNYSFHVLFDTEKKDAKGKYDVVEQFGVDGIPTKFVIDKAGNIRFKSVGWSGSDDSLISELSTMIDLAANPPQVTASIKE